MTSRWIFEALVDLQRRFPAWVVWCNGNGEWSATRPPGYQAPSPGSYLLWVYAYRPDDLVARIREYDYR